MSFKFEHLCFPASRTWGILTTFWDSVCGVDSFPFGCEFPAHGPGWWPAVWEQRHALLSLGNDIRAMRPVCILEIQYGSLFWNTVCVCCDERSFLATGKRSQRMCICMSAAAPAGGLKASNVSSTCPACLIPYQEQSEPCDGTALLRMMSYSQRLSARPALRICQWSSMLWCIWPVLANDQAPAQSFHVIIKDCTFVCPVVVQARNVPIYCVYANNRRWEPGNVLNAPHGAHRI